MHDSIVLTQLTVLVLSVSAVALLVHIGACASSLLLSLGLEGTTLAISSSQPCRSLMACLNMDGNLSV